MNVQSLLTGEGVPTSFFVFIGGGWAPADGEVIFSAPAAHRFYIPASATGSKSKAIVAATAQSIFSLRKNGVEFGTVTFAASGTTGTFSVAASTSFDPANNDYFSIVAPATTDATLADISFTVRYIVGNAP